MFNKNNVNVFYSIHTITGLSIMIFFRLIPNFPLVTDTGMEIFGIFLGTIYLWTFVETLWSSLISMVMVGLSSYAPMEEVLSDFIGNPVVIIVMFMFIMSGALECYGVTEHIAHYFLTRKMINGRPWLFIFIIGIACILLGAFASPFTSILVFWPIMDRVFKQLGYEQNDELPQIVSILIVVSSLIGFPIAPFMQNGLVLIQNYATLTADLPGGPIIIPDAGYLIFTLTMSLILWIATILFSKYVLKPNVDKLKELDIGLFLNDKPEAMDTRQKAISFSFITMIALMLIPSLVPFLPGMDLLKSWNVGIPVITTAVLCMILLADGKPIMDFSAVASKKFMWNSFFIVCTAMYLGEILTHESTGICAFINWALEPFLSQMSPLLFTGVIILIAGILTNLGNSLVICLILQTIILAYSLVNPVIDVMAVNILVIYFSLACAIIFPSASPFAAMMHGNTNICHKLIYKITPSYIALQYTIIVVIGIPLASSIMKIFG